MNAKAHEVDALKAAQRIADLEFLITLLRDEIASLQARLRSNSASSDCAAENAEQDPAAELLRFHSSILKRRARYTCPPARVP